MFYHLPPTGSPISLRDILSAPKTGAGRDLASRLSERMGGAKVALVNSGRTAQTLILQGMSTLAGESKTDVIIPAWTCYSVPASIVRAGLRIRPVDIDPITLDYDYSALEKEETGSVLAVMGCNLFGITTDWKRLVPWAQTRGVFAIDDAAQSLGSSVEGRASGSFGHAGLLSFDRGKNLPAWSGGAMLSSDSRLDTEITNLVAKLAIGESSPMTRVKLMAYSLLLPPNRYWLPASLPFLGLGETEYEPHFPKTTLPEIQKSLAGVLLDRLDSLNGGRQRTARKLIDALSTVPRLKIPGSERLISPIYLRLPVLAESRQHRDALVSQLRARGLGAAVMYPDIVPNIPGLPEDSLVVRGQFGLAREVAAQLFTLPTHAFVQDRDIAQIARILRNT